MRIVLGIEYDGSHFHGFQKQPNIRTVQGELEHALSKVANELITVFCAGRTDTGVHATAQVIHFDTTADRSVRAWIYGSNSFLTHDLTVKWARVVDDSFHARFSAEARLYQYYIYNHPIRPSLLRSGVTWQYRPLDHKLMHQAAQYLLGENDFSAFRAINCQSKSPYRNLHCLNVSRQGDLLRFDVQANAFLHHMVRNLVGSLILVGLGKYRPEWIKEVLLSKKRSRGGETAPAYGLYLVGVKYPLQYSILTKAQAPYFLLK